MGSLRLGGQLLFGNKQIGYLGDPSMLCNKEIIMDDVLEDFRAMEREIDWDAIDDLDYAEPEEDE